MPDPMLFERSPERYRRARPPYPDQLWELLATVGIAQPGVRVLDLGAGTGQVAGPLVQRGALVDAIEPGKGLASLLARDYPTVQVQVCTAEDADYPRGRYDGAVCGTALHWMDLDIVLPRIRDSLRQGAAFVPFWQVFFDPDAEPTPFREAINQMFGERPSASGTPLDQQHWAQQLTQGGHFVLDSVHSWRFQHQMDTAAVADLLSTWNGWTDANIATAVQAVERLGGHVTEHYRTVAYVCRPSSGTTAT